jgi:predicted DNA-binding protein (MmcQ/YjbR family)
MFIGREAVRDQCSRLPGAELSYPFGDDTAVYKVSGKMFALVSLDAAPGAVTVKCDPEISVALRGSYRSITPGYYMNKRHWITVTFEGDVPPSVVGDLVVDSHALVVMSLPARARPSS